MFWVYVTLKIKDGQQEGFQSFFRRLREDIRAKEPGTLRYDLHQHRGDPSRYVIIEQYESDEAFDLHSEWQTKRGSRQDVMQYLEEPATFFKLEPLNTAGEMPAG